MNGDSGETEYFFARDNFGINRRPRKPRNLAFQPVPDIVTTIWGGSALVKDFSANTWLTAIGSRLSSKFAGLSLSKGSSGTPAPINSLATINARYTPRCQSLCLASSTNNST